MRKKEPKENINLLDLTPERIFDFTINDANHVVVAMPRFHVAWMQKYLVPKRRDPFIKITLDEFGSLAWNLCDGTRNVHAISEALVEHFGESVQPVYERIGVFMRQLKDRGFIRLRKMDGSIL
jgi:hypothetical protein